jgi:type I restriction enzyme, S subunit
MALTIPLDQLISANVNPLLRAKAHWPRARIGTFGSVMNGFAFKSTLFTRDRGMPLVRIRDVGDKASETYYAGEFDARYLVEPGDLLIGMDGDFNCARWRGPRSLLNQRVCRVTADPKLCHPRWLDYVLPSYLKAINEATSSITVKHLSARTIEEIPFPLPPMPEQIEIVANIEKQFSRLDEAVAGLQRVRANLQRYKAAVLRDAVEGRLVETEASIARRERRSYECAAEVVARTLVPPRPNRYKSRTTDIVLGHRALAVGMPPIELPEGWTWVHLVDIARMETGHTPSRSRPDWWGGDVPWIGIADARDHHERVIRRTLQYTNAEGIKNSAARLLPVGTVCVSRTASVGYVVVMGEPMATSQDFVNWVPTDAVISDWLRVVFTADRDALLRFGKGSVHKTIYFPEWLSMAVALPPVAEQHRVVAEVDRRLSILRELEAEVDGNLKRAKSLRQAVLAKQFSGA